MNHGYEPQGNADSYRNWTLIPQQAAVYYTFCCEGLFNVPIPLRYAFGMGVSQ
jgi:hypothetical protein